MMCEPNYVVFLGYKHYNQDKGSAHLTLFMFDLFKLQFSNYAKPAGQETMEWNTGTSTVGNRRARHLVPLWRDLECFNILGIILEISNILGVQAKSSTFISNTLGGSITNGITYIF